MFGCLFVCWLNKSFIRRSTLGRLGQLAGSACTRVVGIVLALMANVGAPAVPCRVFFHTSIQSFPRAFLRTNPPLPTNDCWEKQSSQCMAAHFVDAIRVGWYSGLQYRTIAHSTKRLSVTLTSYNKVNVGEYSLRLLQLPRVPLMEHVVYAVRVNSYSSASSVGQGLCAWDPSVVASFSFHFRHWVCAKWCCDA